MALGIGRGLRDEFAAVQAWRWGGVEDELPVAWLELLLPETSATTSLSC